MVETNTRGGDVNQLADDGAANVRVHHVDDFVEARKGRDKAGPDVDSGGGRRYRRIVNRGSCSSGSEFEIANGVSLKSHPEETSTAWIVRAQVVNKRDKGLLSGWMGFKEQNVVLRVEV